MKISVRVAPRQNKNAVVIHLPLNEKVLLLLLQLLLTVMLELNQRVGSMTSWSADRQIRRFGVQTVPGCCREKLKIPGCLAPRGNKSAVVRFTSCIVRLPHAPILGMFTCSRLVASCHN